MSRGGQFISRNWLVGGAGLVVLRFNLSSRTWLSCLASNSPNRILALCFLPGQNVVQEGGGPQQTTGIGAYALLSKFFGKYSLDSHTRVASTTFMG